MGTLARLFFCKLNAETGRSAHPTARPYQSEAPASGFCLIFGEDPLAGASGWYLVAS